MNIISSFRYRSTNSRKQFLSDRKDHGILLFFILFFLTTIRLLLREQPTLGYYWGHSLTFPMLITETYGGFFKDFNPKVTGSLVNAVSCQICSIPFWYIRYNIWSHLLYNKILMCQWYAYLSDLSSSIISLRFVNGNFSSVIPQLYRASVSLYLYL